MDPSVVHTGYYSLSQSPEQSKFVIYSGPDSSVLLSVWVKYAAQSPQGLGGLDVHVDGHPIPDGSLLLPGITAYSVQLFGGDGSRTFLTPHAKRIELVLNHGTVGAYQFLGGTYQITAWTVQP